MIRRFVMLLGAVLALTASTCSAPRPVVTPALVTHSLVVHVVDPNGVGIAGAQVSVVDAAPNPDAGAMATTNANGDVTGWFLQQAGFTLTVTADGYVAPSGTGVTLTSDQTVTITLQRAVPPSQPVHLDGVHLRTTDGAIYRYRAVTAMDLEAVAPDDAEFLFLDWAKATGFHDVRVLTTASLTAALPAATGEAGLLGLCEGLRARHMGAELVLNADTGAQGLSDDAIRAHVSNIARAVQTFCADVPIVMEIANENAHPSQSASLQRVAFLLELRGLVHAVLPTMPVSLGSTCCGQPDTVPPYAGGDYITLHLDRSRTPFWDEVRRVKDLIDLQQQAKQFVADDEGMGAGEADEPGRRSANPTRFFVQGVLDRLGELGSTFHCADCVYAKIPGPVQQACAHAYIAGASIVSDDQVFQFYNDTIGDAATSGGNWSHVEKLFTFVNVTGGPSYVVALNVSGDPGIVWRGGWHQVGQRDTTNYPGISILEIAR